MVEDTTTKHKQHINSNGALLTKSFTARSLRGQMFQKNTHGSKENQLNTFSFPYKTHCFLSSQGLTQFFLQLLRKITMPTKLCSYTMSQKINVSFKFLTISCEAYQVLGVTEDQRSPQHLWQPACIL